MFDQFIPRAPVQIDQFFRVLSTLVGLPADHCKFLFILMTCIPLAVPVPLLPAFVIHSYSIILSFAFLNLILHLGWGSLQLLQMSILTWALVKWGVSQQKAGKRPLGSLKWPWLVFDIAMLQLCANNGYHYFMGTHLDLITITGSQMVLVVKLTGFAWHCYDGQIPAEQVQDLTSRQQRIEKVPNLYAFLGYCFFFPSILAGPAGPYSAYQAFIDGKLKPKPTDSPNTAKSNRFKAAFSRLSTGLFFFIIYANMGHTFGYEWLLHKAIVQQSLVYRIYFANMAGFVARTKYYAVWCLAESAFILSGLAYQPSKGTYTGSRNVNIRQIEFAGNYKVLLDNWNCNTNVWLRTCVYNRLARPGKKPGFKSTMCTFGTSALWHGVNPCYFFTFLLGGFLQSVGRSIRTTVRPFFLPSGSLTASKTSTPPPQTLLKTIYDFICILNLQLSMNFIVIPFVLLDYRPTFLAWRALKWYGLWMTFIPSIFHWSGGGNFLKGLMKQNESGTNGKTKVDQYIDKVEGENGVDKLGRVDELLSSPGALKLE